MRKCTSLKHRRGITTTIGQLGCKSSETHLIAHLTIHRSRRTLKSTCGTSYHQRAPVRSPTHRFHQRSPTETLSDGVHIVIFPILLDLHAPQRVSSENTKARDRIRRVELSFPEIQSLTDGADTDSSVDLSFSEILRIRRTSTLMSLIKVDLVTPSWISFALERKERRAPVSAGSGLTSFAKTIVI